MYHASLRLSNRSHFTNLSVDNLIIAHDRAIFLNWRFLLDSQIMHDPSCMRVGELDAVKPDGPKMGEPAVDGSSGVAGALSRISQATVLDALRVPRTGKVYDLGLELNDVSPSNPAFTPLSLTFTHTPEATGANSPFQFSADTFAGGLHIGTHMDAFIHVQADN